MKEFGYIMPHIPVNPTEDKYEGAVVIEPCRGYYEDPVATLDFASLYPSIMIAHNLCYTTLITPETTETYIQKGTLERKDVATSPIGSSFIVREKQKGLLPLILENLLIARGVAKKALANAKERSENKNLSEEERLKATLEYQVQDGRQLAIKVSANSVYGFTGATLGKLPCIPISSSVTAYGRDMIMSVADTVSKTFTSSFIRDSFGITTIRDTQILYGDTDSVMIRFFTTGPSAIKDSIFLAKEAAKRVNLTFISPINIVFEKVICPFLLVNKKRYIGMYWLHPDKYDHIESKGVESVRRDNCKLVAHGITKIAEILMKEKNKDKAVQYAIDLVSDLYAGRVDFSQLVISKGYTKEGKEYKSKQPHVELARKMEKRDSTYQLHIGDRIPYIVVPGIKDEKVIDRTEDPIYALKHNIQPDVTYYIEQQLKKPFLRIFGPVLKKDSESVKEATVRAESILFHGEGSKKRKFTLPQDSSLSKYIRSDYRCLLCNADRNESICTDCRNKNGEVFLSKLRQYLTNEEKCRRENEENWKVCMECKHSTGTLQENIEELKLCTARECENFYKRYTSEKNFIVVSEKIKKGFSF